MQKNNGIDLLLLLSTPLHQRAASRVQHPKSCGSQQSLPPGGKERLHFVGIRPEVQARKGGIDFFFVTETWLSAHVDEAKTVELAPCGLDVKSFQRQSRSRGGGIAAI